MSVEDFVRAAEAKATACRDLAAVVVLLASAFSLDQMQSCSAQPQYVKAFKARRAERQTR